MSRGAVCGDSTAQKMKFYIKDFMRIWSHSLKKSLMKNFIFCVVFMFEDYSSSYKRIWEKSIKSSMDTKRKHILCIDIYKTLNSLNPSFTREIFKLRSFSRIIRMFKCISWKVLVNFFSNRNHQTGQCLEDNID